MRQRSILVAVSALTLPILASYCGGPQSAAESPATASSASAPIAPPASAAAPPAEPATPAPSAAANVAPSAPVEHKEVHWSYTGEEGPDHWGDIKPEYAACKTGTKQAPIDLPKTAPKSKDLKVVAATYKKPIPVKIINNGHTVQVNNSAEAFITVGTEKYELVQMHVHSPSEHTKDKKSFDMELHLVHKNAKGDFAVIGVLFNKGKENKPLAPFFANAPSSVSQEDASVAGASIDVSALVPAKATYFTYSGSLTTPPCTESVTWLVLEKPAELSDAQLEKLKGALHGQNNRPVQALNGRTVSEVKP